MPKMVCEKCQVAYTGERVGINIIEMFLDPPEPYRITNADVYYCIGCGNRVIAGFANVSTEHHDKGFEEKLAYALAHDHIIVYERVADKGRVS